MAIHRKFLWHIIYDNIKWSRNEYWRSYSGWNWTSLITKYETELEKEEASSIESKIFENNIFPELLCLCFYCISSNHFLDGTTHFLFPINYFYSSLQLSFIKTKFSNFNFVSFYILIQLISPEFFMFSYDWKTNLQLW